jgi:hypothetical protein
MRKITKQTAEALRSFRSFKSGNMQVDHGHVYLHGNEIAYLPIEALQADGSASFLLINDCGWSTPTTRDRLNGLLQAFNLPGLVYQKKGTQYLNEQEWSGTWARVSRTEETKAGDKRSMPWAMTLNELNAFIMEGASK